MILTDDNHAIMTRDDFDKLEEYSCSLPTEGKTVGDGFRWKRNLNAFEPGNMPERWFLGEYVPRSVNKSGILWREILEVT